MIGLESPIFKLYPLSHEHKFLDEEHRRNDFLLTQQFQHNGLQLIKGLCKGLLLVKYSIYGLQTLHNLPRTGTWDEVGGCGTFADRRLSVRYPFLWKFK
ncbi:hypothetical protein VP01_5254g2, partial [Puccinia sorghi]